jgi:zinc protease
MNLPKSLFRLFTLTGAAWLGLNAVSQAEDADAKSPPIVRPWAHEDSDLKPDAALTWGKLDNGLRYVIMPNTEPPNRVSLRLYVDAGSLMEEDNQQGLAQFQTELEQAYGEYSYTRCGF